MELHGTCLGLDFYTNKYGKRYAKIYVSYGHAEYGVCVQTIYVPTNTEQENDAISYIGYPIVVPCEVTEYNGERRIRYTKFYFDS